jgi:hypothetical protein
MRWVQGVQVQVAHNRQVALLRPHAHQQRQQGLRGQLQLVLEALLVDLEACRYFPLAPALQLPPCTQHRTAAVPVVGVMMQHDPLTTPTLALAVPAQMPSHHFQAALVVPQLDVLPVTRFLPEVLLLTVPEV